jgi:hypothetical protein
VAAIADGSKDSIVKNFLELTEQELLALAVSLEEEDNRTYGR